MPSAMPARAYIKSQASQGWKALPQHYDDPAYSGGNLDRPALQQLLKDIDAGRIDVIVVYKIDRLTRSLADFAKLVEAFDAKSISFVAVTQQFNTTTSMGATDPERPVVLCPVRARAILRAGSRQDRRRPGARGNGQAAPFRSAMMSRTRSSSSTRPRPKLSATSSNGIWSCRVLESWSRTSTTRVSSLKRRVTKVKKYNGEIPFTYGPLAYFLKNRLYVGETGHKDKWFPGEHATIVDRKTFDQVQHLLASKPADRRATRSPSHAPLLGKLYDDRGNRMSPSYSTKTGVRYRFYVSSAILRGRTAEVGSVGRVAAVEIENAILAAIQSHRRCAALKDDSDPIELVERAVIARDLLLVTIASLSDNSNADGATETVKIAWNPRPGTWQQWKENSRRKLHLTRA